MISVVLSLVRRVYKNLNSSELRRTTPNAGQITVSPISAQTQRPKGQREGKGQPKGQASFGRMTQKKELCLSFSFSLFPFSLFPPLSLAVFAPKGPQHTSPGHRPGFPCGVTFRQPAAGETEPKSPATFCFALSGLGCYSAAFSKAPLFPGRCPGLICFDPFGANSQAMLAAC